MAPTKHGFLEELKQRHVVRAAIIYAAAVWALAQGISQLSPAFDLSTRVTFWFVIACVIGFPFWIAFAWFFKFTSSGIVREDETAEDPATVHRIGRILDYWIIGILAVAVVLLLTNQLVLQHGKTLREFAAAPTPAANKSATKTVAVATSSSVASAAPPVAAQPIPAKSVAVLPFENLSADKGNAYFADGMQDLILTKLADIGNLKVIARTSTMSYGSHPENLTKIGEQLGVATILEGSVQRAGNQVLINVQLIDARTDSHIWAQSYQRTLDNIFGVEGDVAQKVATALNAKLTQAESTRVSSVMTQNPTAFNDYLRGERYLSIAKAGDFKAVPNAVNAYRSATEADPRFAVAWARLAFTQGLLHYASIDRSDATAQQALANARHALALMPGLPQAHLALGYVYRFDFQDTAKALAEFQLAKQGLPNNAEVDAAIAYIKDAEGDVQAALPLGERAAELDPRNPNLALSLGIWHADLRQYNRARVAYSRVLAVAPEDPEGYSELARVLVLQHGDVAAALAELDRAPLALQASSQIVSTRVTLLLLKRDYPAALKAVSNLKPGGRFITPVRAALQQATVNDLAGNLAAARKGYTHTIRLANAATRTGNLDAGIEIIFAQAGLGHQQAAIEAAQRASSAARRTGFIAASMGVEYALAVAHAKFGDAGQSVAELRHILRSPSSGNTVSVPLLKLDPTWDPIRHDSAFQSLLKKYATDKPGVTYNTPPAGSSSTAVH